MNTRAGVIEIKVNELTAIEQVAAELELMERTKDDGDLAKSLHHVLDAIRGRQTLVCL